MAGGTTWRSLSLGQDHSCGVSTGNTLLCWGNTQLGELGMATSSAEPVLARSETDIGLVDFWREKGWPEYCAPASQTIICR